MNTHAARLVVVAILFAMFLPSAASAATCDSLAPLTVKKAYDELEKDGYIETQRGQGTFVSARAPIIETDAKLERLEPTVQRLVSEASLLGIDEDGLLKMVRNAARSLRTGRKR